MRTVALGAMFVVTAAASLMAAEPVSLATVEPVAEITADERFAKSFSLANAADYLDRAALDWQKSHACTACHTMIPYMMSRSSLKAISPQSAEVRAFFEDVASGKAEAMPAYECKDVDGAVAIGVAVALAMNDRSTTGQLHPLTRQALDRMWTAQRADGSWQWPFRDTPPLKLNEHYGVTLAAVGVGMAPDGYAETPAAKAGLQKVREYLQRVPPTSLHQRAMMLWASAYVDDVLSADAKADVLANLMAVQRPDGGWSMASLVDNTGDASPNVAQQVTKVKAEPGYGRAHLAYVGPDKVYKSSLSSDGYATGFAIYVARQAGIPAEDARLQRGIRWLKEHQRESGRWFTPSQAGHTQHLISNAGTAYAVMALAACGEVEK